MSVHYPETLRRYHHYRKKDDFVVIKYGAEWCRPCKTVSPVLDELAKEHRHVYFLDVDIENEEISEHEDLEGVRTIPHVKFFVDGEMKREIVGVDHDRLHRYVKRYSSLKLNEVIENNQENDQRKEDENNQKNILMDAVIYLLILEFYISFPKYQLIQ
ncbi:unnamed protein product, partial [marine sediment metagenome]